MNLYYDLQISTIKSVIDSLNKIKENSEFEKKKSDDYKNGFDDCLNHVISSMKKIKQEEIEKEKKVKLDEKDLKKFLEEANETSRAAMKRFGKHHKN